MKGCAGTNLIACVLFASCQLVTSNSHSLNGVWESVGSGWVLQIEDSTSYSFYDITSISCLAQRKGVLKEILSSLTLEGDTLSIKRGVVTNKFIKVDNLWDMCLNPIGDKANDPLYNFDVFAETVKEHYAFFELNDVDWVELHSEQRGKLSLQSTLAELYVVIEETLDSLKDNHAFLEAPDSVYNAVEELIPSVATIENDSAPEYGDFPVADMVAKHYLEKDMTQDSWLIKWGVLKDRIGYVQVKSMWLYADLDIPQALIDELEGYVDAFIETRQKLYDGDYIDQEALGVRKVMDRVMDDLIRMDAIVIDLRFNGGGQDAVSFEILSRFVLGELQIATERLRYGDNYTSALSLKVLGTSNPFDKPLYILTSPQTASAAEVIPIASLAMSNARRIGAATAGATSTTLDKILPNGWTFSISNEEYMDNFGRNYENIGIPVDYQLEYSRDRQAFFGYIVNNLEKDKQDVLRAIEKLKSE